MTDTFSLGFHSSFQHIGVDADVYKRQDVEGGYLTTLGDKLNEGIKVMWTGDMVVATIDKSTLDFVNPLLWVLHIFVTWLQPGYSTNGQGLRKRGLLLQTAY